MSLQIGRFGRSWSLQTLSTDNPTSWWSIGRGLNEIGWDSKYWETLGETGETMFSLFEAIFFGEFEV